MDWKIFMKLLSVLFCGLLFAFGLALSGMTDTTKVIGFLDITGNWNPALLFVMIGTIGTHSLFYFLFKQRTRPLLAESWHLPTLKSIDKKLIIGSAIFGIGWGTAGICPGPAITALPALLTKEIFIFILSMLIGMLLHHFLIKKINL